MRSVLLALFILLGQVDRDQVRGPSLEPIERRATPASPDPVYILGLGVLDDPAHAAHRDFLGSLPRMDSDDPAFPPALVAPE